MKCIGSFNGRKIFTDKNPSSISMVNNRVKLGDGSWVDLATGEIHNCGKGMIALDSPSNPTGTPNPFAQNPFVQKRYQATELAVTDISARVNIEPWNGSEIVIDAGGLQEDELAVQCKNGRVSLKDLRNASGRMFSEDRGPMVVNIRAPVGIKLFLSGIDQDLYVGSIHGDVELDQGGTADVILGNVGRTKIVHSGTGNMEIYGVSGGFDLKFSGAGNVRVREGNVDDLVIRSSGTGNITFNGRAQRASVKSSGIGNVKVHEVVERPSLSHTGIGNFKVGNW